MKRKDCWEMENEDTWEYPGSSEDSLSAQEGTVIREYRLDSSKHLCHSFEMLEFALPNQKDKPKDPDED